ncbi:MAG: hypothetical protein ACYDHW_04500 [Syntrophorhabdaceae bacterium]
MFLIYAILFLRRLIRHRVKATKVFYRLKLSLFLFYFCPGFCYCETMGKKDKKPVRAVDDRTRSRRFLFLWLPVIIVVIVAFYAIAMDPPQPTGRMVKAQVIEKDRSVQSQVPRFYRIRLENGDEASIAIPEKEDPRPLKSILVEEHSTRLFKKKSYQYRP